MKRGSGWVGYKTHLTETCEPDTPHMIVNLTTTAARVADNDLTPTIHAGLAGRDLLPDIHLIDSGYTGAELVVISRTTYDVELLGPAREDCSWQAKAGEASTPQGSPSTGMPARSPARAARPRSLCRHQDRAADGRWAWAP